MVAFTSTAPSQGSVAPGAATVAEAGHPGGELATLAVAGKDVTADFDVTLLVRSRSVTQMRPLVL